MLYIQRLLLSTIVPVAILGVVSSAAHGQCAGGGTRAGKPPVQQQLRQQQLVQQFMLQQLTQQQLLQYQLMQQQLTRQLRQQNLLQQSLLQDPNSPKTSLQTVIQQVSSQDEAALLTSLTHERDIVRLVAALVIGQRGLALHNDLIPLLTDRTEAVRQAARRSLVQLAAATQKQKAAEVARRYSSRRRIDFGPAANAGQAAQARAAEKWREWWDNKAIASVSQ
jgi:hypothetical protein